MKKATLQTIARDVRAIARSVSSSAAAKPGRQPALKAVQLGQGEIEVGVTIDDNRQARLILLTGHVDAIKACSHAEAEAYAKKHNASLPTRIDGLVLFARAKDKFKTDDGYWTSETYAGRSSDAWNQWFSNGTQLHWDEDGRCRVCLVRRLPI